MLSGSDSVFAHRLQNALLILLSIIFVSPDLYLALFSYLVSKLIALHPPRHLPESKRRTFLVTGVGMTKGLALARAFYEAGHTVIGADFETDGVLVCGRFSRSLKKYYSLRKPTTSSGSGPYVQSLLDIVIREKIDVWVSCSGVASAVEDGEAKEAVEANTKSKAIQFDVKTTQMLHEKHSFIEHTASLGLTVPETHSITDRKTLEHVLQNAPPGRKYIMKTVGVDDSVRADMTLLPLSTKIETSKHIARLKISEKTPWIAQQYIKGSEYCTHAVVVRGQVNLFVACPSAELLMHYEALPFDSPLSQAMLEFTKTYAERGGKDFTGHLSFDFMVDDAAVKNEEDIVLYPIECNPRAHTAVALFQGTPGMVDAYLSLLDEHSKESPQPVIRPAKNNKYYWIGHDLVNLVILCTWDFLMFQNTLEHLLKSYGTFLDHLLLWKDGTFEFWDPVPFWVLYHVFWPMQFVTCLRKGKKWSRINVSTTKMFEC